MGNSVLLQMKGITKEFPGVKALDGVNLSVYENKVMALLGENGAGKSTLMKILSGVYQKTSGEMFFRGEALSVSSPKDAMHKGIAIIHQELNLIESLSISENIFMGRFPRRGAFMDWKKLHEDAAVLLKRLNSMEDPRTLVRHLSIGQKQLVEIAKALSFDAQLIIMDEPTDALTDQEAACLFEVIKQLVASGKSVVYISHRLPEIFQVCDDVTILRDGQFIAEKAVCDIDENGLIELMVGRKLEDQYPYVASECQETVFEVHHLSNHLVKDISFKLKKGEVLGIAGLMGAGRTELAKSIYGNIPTKEKKLSLLGQSITVHSERDSLREGVAYVSEDRKKDGLILGMSVAENVTLASLNRYSKASWIMKKSEGERVSYYKETLQIKTPSLSQRVKLLSGGNQQKVAIAKALSTQPKVLILDEPTRGVDVGAKREIYELMNQLKVGGLGILMISSEIPELLGVCDRIMVMHQGRIAGILSREEATQESIMRLAVGAGEPHEKN